MNNPVTTCPTDPFFNEVVRSMHQGLADKARRRLAKQQTFTVLELARLTGLSRPGSAVSHRRSRDRRQPDPQRPWLITATRSVAWCKSMPRNEIARRASPTWQHLKQLRKTKINNPTPALAATSITSGVVPDTELTLSGTRGCF